MSNKILIGAHASISKGFVNSLKSITQIGGNSIQIFLKSPRGRISKELNEEEAKNCKKYLKENKLFLVGHCSYLLNFAKDPSLDSWPIQSLIDDMIKIEKLGGIGVVLHIGKYLEMKKDEALKNINFSVSKVLNQTPENTKVIFENTAGQGTEIGFKIEELKEIYDLFTDEQKKRIGFCLDTCHAFVAGYDLSNREGVLNWKEEFNSKIGINKIICIHFNDAKKELNSKVDRHQDIGFGFIGEEGLRQVAKIANENNIPLILETTTEHMSYENQIKLIKNWF